jgi:trans-2,3-dihydro-3-hydroxyanthranilate isomerase
MACGPRFTLVSVGSLSALRAASVQTGCELPEGIPAAICAFAFETVEATNLAQVRVFAPEYSIAEDAATGSAAACKAALLLRHDVMAAHTTAPIEQGHSLGRPSVLYISAWFDRGQIQASIGGRVHVTARGTLVCLP